jgi:phage-related protein
MGKKSKARREAQSAQVVPSLRAGENVPSLVQPARKPKPKILPAAFYRTKKGKEPVRDWLKGFSKADKIKIGVDIARLEYEWPVGLPTCKPLLKGLWEVRTSLKDRIARVIFFNHDGKMVLLHGFIKKTEKTPQVDIDLAYERKKEVEKGK